MQKVSEMNNWWTPKEEDFKSIENLILILSTLNVSTATKFYFRAFICIKCDAWKNDCTCDDE